MNTLKVKVSPQFQQYARKASLAIVLFLFVYLLLLVLAVGLFVFCAFAGLAIVIAYFGIFSIFVGLGILSLGILVIYFLVKFIFTRKRVDRSNMVEINESDAPELFQEIKLIVQQVGTHFPKRIYLSPDVNAMVFYDSNFLSMFFPVRKNLAIGIGLVNILDRDEFRAVLGHEFGHFSQESMKIGSYVYQFNRVVHNMLYENDSLEKGAGQFSNISWIFSIFVWIAFQFIRFVQWILRLMYQFVYKSYMALSREMEYHADEIAANIVGARPMASGLLRLELAEYALQTTINKYQHWNLSTPNIYPQQFLVMKELAKSYELKFENGLPQIPPGLEKKYNPSKLVMSNQWASHPTTEDRVQRLKDLNLPERNRDYRMAATLFSDFQTWGEMFTERFLRNIEENRVESISDATFLDRYQQDKEKYQFPAFYNGYYNFHNLPDFTGELHAENLGKEMSQPLEELFNQKAIDTISEGAALESDLAIIYGIQQGWNKQRTFDYDGIKYGKKDVGSLYQKLEAELTDFQAKIKDYDWKILCTFFQAAEQKGVGETFLKLHQDYQAYLAEYKELLRLLDRMRADTQFIQQRLPFDEIRHYFRTLEPVEEKFKKALSEMLEKEVYQAFLVEEMVEHIRKYVKQTWQYFVEPAYNQDALDMLYTSLHYFDYLLGQVYFEKKKRLLVEQLEAIGKVA